jgi:septum formation protein
LDSARDYILFIFEHELLNKMKSAPIILASKSPRRKELLKETGLKISIVPSSINEDDHPKDLPTPYVKTLAKAKAAQVAQQFPDSWVIGADTIVLIDDVILEKPRSRTQARSMLVQLSGRTHQVYTGYCICCKTKHRQCADVVITDVHFKKLTNNEIEWYISTTEPYDKAGGYAIQGLGSFLVKAITGSYTNVVGLPVCEILDFFIKEGLYPLSDGQPDA